MNWFIKFIREREITITEKEFNNLPQNEKTEYLKYIVDISKHSLTFEYKLLSNEQRIAYCIRIAAETNLSLTDDKFKFLPEDKKILYLKDRLGRFGCPKFSILQVGYFDYNMFEKIVGNSFLVTEEIFNLMPHDLKIKHMNKIKYNDGGLDTWLLEFYRNYRKRRAIAINRDKNIDELLN